MAEKALNVAIYARVSTTDQRCEVQLTELRRYADARGWAVFHEYIDHGFSGKTMNRPALKRCMSDARAKRFDSILVWKLDRWGRTVAQLAQDVIEFDELGIRFMAVEQGIDTAKSNAMGRFVLHIMSAFAELERAMIQERVVAGVRHAQKHGTRTGNAIGRPKVIFNGDKVRELAASGMTERAIAAKMDLSLGTVHRTIAAGRLKAIVEKSVGRHTPDRA